MLFNSLNFSGVKQAYRLEVEDPDTKEWVQLLDRRGENVYHVDKEEAERYAKHILRAEIQSRIVLVVF